MKQGYVRITNRLIKEVLGFPVDWEIVAIRPSSYDGVSCMLISGSDFPETSNYGRAIKDVEIIIHKEAVKFEVRER